ncbi:MAG: exodeoxyribonuclease VII small subunit [Synergistales bacterium]|nr:exodeoxyribonuclease VII small subunit [Synergistales bacterium]
MSFTQDMEELQKIVHRLESEAMPLEDALSLFEEGIARLRTCQAFLKDARQRVTRLSSETLQEEEWNPIRDEQRQ